MAGATFVLVPGAGGSAWYWHRLVTELTGRGHRAVAVELPARDDAAGLTEYAEAALAAFSSSPAAAGRQGELVLVAQSMAGLIAPELARRLPASLVVLLNAMIPAPGELAGQWWGNTGQGEAQRAMDVREGRPADAGFDPVTYFLHDLPPELLEEAYANAPEQSGTPFGRPGPDVTWPDVPIRVLAGRADRFFPLEFQRRVARERLGAEVGSVVEVPGGHLAALSHPAPLADRLERYLAELAPAVTHPV
jgi:pimeloyl-ACP methyl ester carboxylesterase